MAAYRRVYDLRSTAGLLPVHRDQLQAQRSVSSMGKPLPFTFYIQEKVARIGRTEDEERNNAETNCSTFRGVLCKGGTSQ